MREIKFRAWDKQEKEMQSCEIVHNDRFYRYVNNLKYVLMQFTGLKDKNGKEIYEGDILTDNISDKNFEVFWNDLGFWEGVGKDFKMVGSLGILDPDSYRFEIIGNIYKNPKLMEEKGGEKCM